MPLFDPDIFDTNIFDSVEKLLKFEEVIRQMEKVNVGTYCFEAGCVEPGVDNCDVPLRRLLVKLEK